MINFNKIGYALLSFLLFGASFVYFIASLFLLVMSYVELYYDKMSFLILAIFAIIGISFFISSFYIKRWAKGFWKKFTSPAKTTTQESEA